VGIDAHASVSEIFIRYKEEFYIRKDHKLVPLWIIFLSMVIPNRSYFFFFNPAQKVAHHHIQFVGMGFEWIW
jgi:hypothetical protein